MSAVVEVAVVTPRVGVWIEITKSKGERAEVAVTPRVGVWIEIGSVCGL